MKKDIQHYIKQRLLITDKLYDYSLIDDDKNYKLTDKITVICPEHGEFTTSARNHFIQGRQCPACAKKAPVHKSELIKRRTAKMYDYSLIPNDYIKSQDFVTIICPEHGEFKQRCYAHFRNQQLCKKCSNEIVRQKSLIANKIKLQPVYTNDHGYKFRIYNKNKKPTLWLSNDFDTNEIINSYGFVYNIINLNTGKTYIGKRKVPSLLYSKQNNSWGSYKGSSNAIKQAIKYEGINNFKFIICGIYDNAEDLRNAELQAIKDNDAINSDNFYNIALT